MSSVRIGAAAVGVALLLGPAAHVSAGRGQGAPSITIRAARVLDGVGGTLANGVVEVRGTKIVAVDQRTGPVTYDLGGATVLPGLIDVHVHLNWYFGPDGRYGGRGVLPSHAADAILDNARATLMAGFTTVQSLGWAGDKGLRDAVAAGTINGPRILTSLGQLQGGTNTPEQLRERVRQAKSEGADVIKFFASASIRDGGKMNVSQAQLDAVCGEAKAVGLRTAVHAHSAESVIAAVNAGCTQIEHGMFVDDAAIKAMADARVFFDPNIGLVLQNYLEHREQYVGVGQFQRRGLRGDEVGAAEWRRGLPQGAGRGRPHAARHRRRRRRARPERARDRGAGRRRRPAADGRHHQRDVAGGRLTAHGRHDRHTQVRI